MSNRKILVPVDGSSPAESIFDKIEDHLCDSAGKQKLVLLQAVQEYPPYFPFLNQEDFSASVIRQSRVYLTGLGNRLMEKGYQVEIRVREGEAGEVILQEAEGGDIDLIAMTTHGASGVRRFLLGSVAEKVVRHTSSPVYLARSE